MEREKNIYDAHLFVCINEREPPKSGCGDLGSKDLLTKLKEELAKKNLTKKVRINKSGCLDQCSKGPSMVIYPQGKWFFHVSVDDIPEIIREIEK